jgi:hypothetical protein
MDLKETGQEVVLWHISCSGYGPVRGCLFSNAVVKSDGMIARELEKI